MVEARVSAARIVVVRQLPLGIVGHFHHASFRCTPKHGARAVTTGKTDISPKSKSCIATRMRQATTRSYAMCPSFHWWHAPANDYAHPLFQRVKGCSVEQILHVDS
jgi:hypothetical protein